MNPARMCLERLARRPGIDVGHDGDHKHDHKRHDDVGHAYNVDRFCRQKGSVESLKLRVR